MHGGVGLGGFFLVECGAFSDPVDNALKAWRRFDSGTLSRSLFRVGGSELRWVVFLSLVLA